MMRIFLRGYIFLLGCTLCSTLSIDKLQKSPSQHAIQSITVDDMISSGLRATAISASVFIATMVMPPIPASYASPITLNEAIVEVSETSYPILKGLDAVNFQAFSVKIGELLLNINPDKLGKSIELGMDVLDSAPSEKLDEFNIVLKEIYNADLNIDSCTLVPLPPMSIVDRFATIAVEKVDPDKLKTFQETWKPSLDALAKSKTDNSICLPSTRSSLDKLALSQANLARSFSRSETKEFTSYLGPVLKSSITPGKALALVKDAQTLAPNASQQAKKDFAAAGKKAETASQLENARNKIAEQKAQQAANKAALIKN
jgi:hypothetical protein